MKRTDLAKHKGKKIDNLMNRAVPADRFGGASSAVGDRKEQRKRERARGLVPFAVKLNGDFAASLRALAEERNLELNQLVEELLRKGLEKA